MNLPIKPRKCANKACRSKFIPERPFIVWCSPECGEVIAKSKIARANVLRAKKQRREYREAKEKQKTRGDWIKEAQAAVNAYCRARDLKAGYGCIDCGKPFEPQRPGGSVDAGHYLGRGAYPELRFDERNIHAQRKNCNRPGGTTAASFRLGMIARVGIEVVEWLEGPHEPKHYSIEELKQIKSEYKQKLKSLVSRGSD